MKNLKKIGAIGGAISLALCWPLAVGQIGQTIIQDEIKDFHSDIFSLELLSYNRRYLSAVATTQVTITDPILTSQLSADGLPTTFQVHSDIQHGLTSLSGQSIVSQMAELPLVLDTETKLNGDTRFNLKMDSIEYENSMDQFSANTQPASLQGEFNVNGEVSFNFALPSIMLSFSSGDQLVLTDLKGQGTGVQNHHYWLGEQQVSLGEILLTQPDDSIAFLANNISYHGNTFLDEQGTRLTSKIALGAETLTMANEPDVQDATLRFSLDGVDASAFNYIIEALQTQNQAELVDVASLIPQFERLFEQGFSVAIDEFSMRIGEGKFGLDFFLQIAEGTKGITQDPMKVIAATGGEMNSFVSNALVSDFPDLKQGVDELLIMEMVDEVEDGFKLNAQISNGNVIFANGQKVPIFTLLMPVFMQ